MNKRLQALLQRRAAAVEKMKAINAAAGENIFTEEQNTEFNAAKLEAEQLGVAVEQARSAIEAERTVAGGVVVSDIARLEVAAPPLLADPRRGFASFGQFLASVRGASLNPSAIDERLQIGAAATTYANESVGADGGFLVPPEYANEIFSVIDSGEDLFSRVRKIPVSGSEWKYPVNETTAHGTNGVQAYWDGEGDQITPTKPVFKNGSIKLARLTCLIPVTEESLEDSSALGAWMNMEAGEKMGFKVSDAILNGTGAGMPLGVMNAPSLVTVAKETSQPANSLLAANVLKMWSRMPARNRAKAVWVTSQDIEPLLPQMAVAIKNVAGTENVGGFPVYMPPGGMTGAQHATLMGRPVVMTEASPALSAAGDIMLADFSQYIGITKGGVKAEQSMHFYFDQNIRAFRFVMRFGGQPWLSAPIARKVGSNTLSHFVALGAR